MRSGPSSPRRRRTATPTDPADDRKGDTWDHVAIDAESRLVVSVVPGERTAENVVAVVEDFKRRTGGRLMDLITTDGYPAYEEAILEAYGETITPPRTGKRGRPKAPYKVAPQGLTYAVVEKTREKGRVVAIATRVVFGTMAAVIAALGDVEGEPGDQHVVRGAAERDGPAPQRPEGPQDVPVQQGLAVSRGGDLPDDVRLQLLLAGADAADQGRSRALAEAKPGDGGRAGGSCLVDPRMAGVPIRATLIGHEGFLVES